MPLADGQVVAGYTILRTPGPAGWARPDLVQHPWLPLLRRTEGPGAAVSKDEEYRQQFNLEADMVSTLTHPHIVTIHDRGEFDDKLWITGVRRGHRRLPAARRKRYPYGMPPDDVVRIITAIARRWITRTARACCIGTSNPPTSCSGRALSPVTRGHARRLRHRALGRAGQAR